MPSIVTTRRIMLNPKRREEEFYGTRVIRVIGEGKRQKVKAKAKR